MDSDNHKDSNNMFIVGFYHGKISFRSNVVLIECYFDRVWFQSSVVRSTVVSIKCRSINCRSTGFYILFLLNSRCAINNKHCDGLTKEGADAKKRDHFLVCYVFSPKNIVTSKKVHHFHSST